LNALFAGISFRWSKVEGSSKNRGSVSAKVVDVVEKYSGSSY